MKTLIIILFVLLSISAIADRAEYLKEENFDMIFNMGVISTIEVYESNKTLTRKEIRALAINIANKKYSRTVLRLLLSK